jgi:hypothetical protein
MTGLNPDWSDKAVRKRVAEKTSGLAPHERPGHRAPNPPADRDLSAQAAIDALRHPLPGEETGI